MRVVLDTNVLVSAALFPKSRVGQILILAAGGHFNLVLSPFILAELERVLAMPKIDFTPARIREAVEGLEGLAEIVEPKVVVRAITTHEDDNRILECALAAKADVLVTGDLHDIRPLGTFQGIEILTPREFLDKFFPP